ncbi:MAG TPA: 2OG-Fe(II) oxygenase, partial [Parafilimonas sp.]|nr:2OG-Fe(II) oxygenase [Parafilimonas sp.]
MTDYDKNILDCLNNIKGNGSFVSSHKAAFVFPGLEVEGVGELSYPINEWQAKALIQQAHKAPFGKGSQTVFDDTVRRAWEIDASMLTFKGNQWQAFLKKALNTIKPDLGIEDYKISASLYKMLIYEKDSFFLPHRDSEKEKGMFGTLVIGLPSKHTGGELAVRFDGQEKLVHFDAGSDSYEIPYAAFYADCEHEIKPLVSGYRICLVYNLIQDEAGKKIQAEPLGKHVKQLAAILKNDEENDSAIPKIILLGHQYTPENFSMKSLKLNDRTRAEALLSASELAGYYAKMCLVTSYKAGSPAWGGGYDDEPDEDTAMEEVYDETLNIEHWMNDGAPPLRNIQFEEKDLLAAFHINDDEPIVKESTGYMGNYGPDIMHWYHYGAVMLWSKKMQEQLLPQQNNANKLEWIAYYNKNRNRLSESEKDLCESILSGNLDSESHRSAPDYNVIADWLTGMNDEIYFEEKGNRLLQNHF